MREIGFRMKKVYIETYGCQMNVADTEVVFSILEKHGYGRTQEMDEADVIMANTCSIRDNGVFLLSFKAFALFILLILFVTNLVPP